MSTGMGNAIRWLKGEILKISTDMSDGEAKSKLVAMIADYVKERITAAGDVIAESGAEKIQDGDVILTFATSSTVQRLLIAARAMGRRFRVIVIDSRPHNDGLKLVRSLVAAGFSDFDASAAAVGSPASKSVPADQLAHGKGRGRNGLYGGVTYAPITALSFLMREASKVFLGAESFFANGAMLSRAGTAMVALSARTFHVPVIVACETYKFSEKIQLDAVVSNELGVPDALMYKTGVPDAEPVGPRSCPYLSEMEYSAYARDRYAARPRWNNRCSLASESPAELPAAAAAAAAGKKGKGTKPGASAVISDEAKALAALNKHCPLSDWRSTHNLRLMNLTQDITPPEFVSVIITEVGMIPTTSIPVVLREYKNQI
ncbi:hypothetical protein GGI02_001314 [Coemansia sp. RSA 2322]|nr:hypothetical protein GGI02_001314 [Coemansia sp. RSA 2322]